MHLFRSCVSYSAYLLLLLLFEEEDKKISFAAEGRIFLKHFVSVYYYNVIFPALFKISVAKKIHLR